MSTTVLSIRSVDGNLELAFCSASVELRLSAQASKDFDDACEAQQSGAWLPVWLQIKWALVSAAQVMGHKVADTLRSIPLEAVTDMTFEDGRLQVHTAKGNQIGGHVKMEMGSYKVEYQLDDPGIFAETDATTFAQRFSEVKPHYDAYLAQLRPSA